MKNSTNFNDPSLLVFYLVFKDELKGYLINRGIQEADANAILSDLSLRVLLDTGFEYDEKKGTPGARSYLYWKLRNVIADYFRGRKEFEFLSDFMEADEGEKFLGVNCSLEEFQLLKEPMIEEALAFAGYEINPEGSREYLLRQYGYVKDKLKSGKVSRYKLLIHLKNKFPDLDLDDLLDNSFDGE